MLFYFVLFCFFLYFAMSIQVSEISTTTTTKNDPYTTCTLLRLQNMQNTSNCAPYLPEFMRSRGWKLPISLIAFSRTKQMCVRKQEKWMNMYYHWNIHSVECSVYSVVRCCYRRFWIKRDFAFTRPWNKRWEPQLGTLLIGFSFVWIVSNAVRILKRNVPNILCQN